MKKRVDDRVRQLIANCVAMRNRGLFVIVGDKARLQVANLHWTMLKVNDDYSDRNNLHINRQKRVLWCFKHQDQLGFAANLKKRRKLQKKQLAKGRYDPGIEDPFELFLSQVDVRYTYYSDTENILGQTYSMCILQDFEALTPNILCRTIETVQGGGLVCILLTKLSSLKDLYDLTMDRHRKFRKDGTFQSLKARFNERFLLSLRYCDACLVVDDELNILPITKASRFAGPLVGADEALIQDESSRNKLIAAHDSIKDIQGPLGRLAKLAITMDQFLVVKDFVEIAARKKLSTTVALTAARGRGKSAALGLAVAAAIMHGFSNIFLSSPSPDNVATVFEFIQKGLEACDLVEHREFQLIQEAAVSPDANERSTQNPLGATKDLEPTRRKHKAIIRMNITNRNHRQSVQYVYPDDYQVVKHQAELLVVDEAAAIPLPTVRKLIGPYLVFLSSTVHGYEGTGRALSLKLMTELKSASSVDSTADANKENSDVEDDTPVVEKASQRSFKKLTLEEPIRYAAGDRIEQWLSDLLCLGATEPHALSKRPLPLPGKCNLHIVDRDALFSAHKASEFFLRKLMSLFISSHYKNTPNDLALLSDAPAHFIFALLPPLDNDDDPNLFNSIPDVYCAIHVSMEGSLNSREVKASLSRGVSLAGDLLPWTLSQYFSDENFAALVGARIVRIATHPSLQKMGYGTEALRQLLRYFASPVVVNECHMINAATGESSGGVECDRSDGSDNNMNVEDSAVSLHTETLSVRATPPLLAPCDSTPFTRTVHYIGTAFGVTLPLFRFWRKNGFRPVYIRPVTNDVTGEFSLISLCQIASSSKDISAPQVEHESSSASEIDCEREDGEKDDDQTVQPESSKSVAIVAEVDVMKFVQDFRSRLLRNLSGVFRDLDPILVLSMLEPAVVDSKKQESVTKLFPPLTSATLSQFLTDHDVLRLQKYSQLTADYSLILDLLQPVSLLVMADRVEPRLSLSSLQAAIMIACGLQRRTVASVAGLFNIPKNQVLAVLNKAISKVHAAFNGMLEADVAKELYPDKGAETAPSLADLDMASGQRLHAPGGRLPERSLDNELKKVAAERRIEKSGKKLGKRSTKLKSR